MQEREKERWNENARLRKDLLIDWKVIFILNGDDIVLKKKLVEHASMQHKYYDHSEELFQIEKLRHLIQRIFLKDWMNGFLKQKSTTWKVNIFKESLRLLLMVYK